MLKLLRRISGHKYGWTYISRAELQTADALERRGLVTYGRTHGRDHYNCPQVVATQDGIAEIKRHWPDSPAARGFYKVPA